MRHFSWRQQVITFSVQVLWASELVHLHLAVLEHGELVFPKKFRRPKDRSILRTPTKLRCNFPPSVAPRPKPGVGSRGSRQEFMILPTGAASFREAMNIGAEARGAGGRWALVGWWGGRGGFCCWSWRFCWVELVLVLVSMVLVPNLGLVGLVGMGVAGWFAREAVSPASLA